MKAKNASNIIQKSKTEEIKSLASKIVSSKKHCNSVVKIFEFLLEVTNNTRVSQMYAYRSRDFKIL